MFFLWLIPLCAVLYFLFGHQGQKVSAWVWGVAIALFALPVVGMLFMGGAGGLCGGWGPGFGGRGGMMGPGRGYPYGGMMGPRQGYGGPGPYQFGHGFAGGRVWMVVFMLLVVVGLILLAYFAFRRQQGLPAVAAPSAPAVAESSALEQLRMRLAKGEISAEEYDGLRQKLME